MHAKALREEISFEYIAAVLQRGGPVTEEEKKISCLMKEAGAESTVAAFARCLNPKVNFKTAQQLGRDASSFIDWNDKVKNWRS